MVSPYTPIPGRCRTVLGGPGAWKTSLRSVGCAKRRIGRANAAGQHRSRLVARVKKWSSLNHPIWRSESNFLPISISLDEQIGIQSAFRWGFTMDLPTIYPSTAEDMVFPPGRATVPRPSRWDWTKNDVGLTSGGIVVVFVGYENAIKHGLMLVFLRRLDMTLKSKQIGVYFYVWLFWGGPYLPTQARLHNLWASTQ